ncbi:methyltransferase [Brevibacillus sp. LEMMJ03]|uniref:methyltransferase n=1 Tax=Brevibacillus sp. LEMMJ03 TaxID=2595056 RepID=UPI00117D299F|nr:methyltransferase [Brevibacillus sp. LEMMJ03]TRY23946.1 methyltransferase [Brevibacillus sp. LEMMJ03]
MQNEKKALPQPASADRVMEWITGGWVQQAIYVAAKLGIADLLADGPKSAGELAEVTETHAPSLYRILRALCGIGLFQEEGEQRFALGPLGSYLQTGENSLRGMAIMVGEKWHRDAWSHIMYTVKTGKPAFQDVHGMGVFAYLANHPDAGERFNQAMSDMSHRVVSALAYDFSPYDRVIDVGGGHGRLMTAILNAHPGLKGVIYDVPSVIEGTRRHIAEAGLTDRCACIAGSFFESVPAGGDLYVLKNILHDWSDDEAAAILRNCRRAIREDGKLLVMEMVVPAGNQPHPSTLIDLEMMIMATGRERTEAEFRTLFRKADFELERIVPTSASVCMLEGIPV